MATLAVSVAVGQVVASALLDPLIERVLSNVWKKDDLSKGIEEEIRDLHFNLTVIKGVLKDAEEKQVKNEAVLAWLKELQQVLYDADDLLDEYATDVALRAAAGGGAVPEIGSSWKAKGKAKVSDMFCCFSNNFGFHGNNINLVATKLKSIIESLDKIAKVSNNLGLQVLPGESNVMANWRRPETCSFLADEESVIGREEAKNNIVKLLLASANEEQNIYYKNFSVLPVVGIGGVGKTTLAQLVFHDKEVGNYFQKRIWVCVSNDFNVERLRREITESAVGYKAGQEQHSFTNWDMLHTRFNMEMEGKRFLLVLDDAWNEDGSLWHDLLEPLNVGGGGSMVLVTTRNTSVANAIKGRMNPILLEGLPDEDIGTIFKRFAFGNRSSSEYIHLEVIADQMILRLKGSPLAARSLGCLLNSYLDVKHWRRILESDCWASKQDELEIFPVLRLSYQHLHTHLKQCFLFCGLFPKDYEFQKDELVQLWMAQNFIQAENGTRLEDVGTCYFNDLFHISFFQTGPDQHYMMHDLIHDLALSTSQDNHFCLTDDVSKGLPQKIRHVSIISNNDITRLMDICKCTKLRTLLFFPKYTILFDVRDILGNWMEKLKFLRVICLKGCLITQLPESIGSLKHLRYLDLSGTRIEKLPNSFNNLFNLQVLKLYDIPPLNEFPTGMTKFVSLRHLRADFQLMETLDGIGNLTSLQYLQYFNVQKKSGHTITELKNLNMLHGSLRLKNLQNVQSQEEASQARLDKKEHLETLELVWGDDSSRDNTLLEQEVLEGLKPNIDLKELEIRGYKGNAFSSWMNSESLPCLEVATIEDCKNLVSFPPFCQLNSLKVLKIRGTKMLKLLGDEFHGNGSIIAFRSLETLEFSNMDQWEEWIGVEESISFLPRLRNLCIGNCPMLREIPAWIFALKTLDELRIYNCPELKPVLDWGFPNLVSLRTAVLSGCPKVASSLSVLPECRRRSNSLQGLQIHYHGECPNLMYLQGLQSLVTLVISEAHNIESIGRGVLSDLRNLKSLKIADCERLTLLEVEALVSLKHLSIKGCPDVAVTPPSSNLSHPSGETGGGGLGVLPSLKALSIKNCPKLLRSFPPQGGTMLPSSLISLVISDDDSIEDMLLCTCLQNLVSLGRLKIRGCPHVTSLSNEISCQLTKLRTLSISSCMGLKFLGMQALVSLRHLAIDDCPRVTITPFSAPPTSLTELVLGNTSPQQLTSFLFQFSAFRPKKLGLHDCPELTCFDGEMGAALLNLTSLTWLAVTSCPNLRSLAADLQRLSSLRTLGMYKCPQMQSLPDTCLPASLWSLNIWGCPELKRRYSPREKGPGWSNISHIPDVNIY